MATTPYTFSEGDTPTKARLDTFIAALQETVVVTGETGLRYLTPFRSSATYNVLRTRRYLHFRSNGLLVDPAAIEDDITLSESDNGRGTLDLDTTWVAYGVRFVCTGVNAVWHDDEP